MGMDLPSHSCCLGWRRSSPSSWLRPLHHRDRHGQPQGEDGSLWSGIKGQAIREKYMDKDVRVKGASFRGPVLSLATRWESTPLSRVHCRHLAYRRSRRPHLLPRHPRIAPITLCALSTPSRIVRYQPQQNLEDVQLQRLCIKTSRG